MACFSPSGADAQRWARGRMVSTKPRPVGFPRTKWRRGASGEYGLVHNLDLVAPQVGDDASLAQGFDERLGAEDSGVLQEAGDQGDAFDRRARSDRDQVAQERADLRGCGGALP